MSFTEIFTKLHSSAVSLIRCLFSALTSRLASSFSASVLGLSSLFSRSAIQRLSSHENTSHSRWRLDPITAESFAPLPLSIFLCPSPSLLLLLAPPNLRDDALEIVFEYPCYSRDKNCFLLTSAQHLVFIAALNDVRNAFLFIVCVYYTESMVHYFCPDDPFFPVRCSHFCPIAVP